MRISDWSSDVCSSDLFMRAQAMRMVSVSHWRKMIVVRCGIDLATLPPAAPHRENGPARIICVGRLAAETGYFGLLEALAAVGPSNGGAEIVVVGDGPMAAAVWPRAREPRCRARNRF